MQLEKYVQLVLEEMAELCNCIIYAWYIRTGATKYLRKQVIIMNLYLLTYLIKI